MCMVRQPLKGQYGTIGIFMVQKSKGEPLTIVGDGEQRFTHVSDVVNANIMAALVILRKKHMVKFIILAMVLIILLMK